MDETNEAKRLGAKRPGREKTWEAKRLGRETTRNRNDQWKPSLHIGSSNFLLSFHEKLDEFWENETSIFPINSGSDKLLRHCRIAYYVNSSHLFVS